MLDELFHGEPIEVGDTHLDPVSERRQQANPRAAQYSRLARAAAETGDHASARIYQRQAREVSNRES